MSVSAHFRYSLHHLTDVMRERRAVPKGKDEKSLARNRAACGAPGVRSTRKSPLGALAKPEKRKTTKGRKDRAEDKVVKVVRELCVARDGQCRFNFFSPWNWACPQDGAPPLDVKPFPHRCDGPSEWAHLGDQKRARTRGQQPDVRHTTAGSCILCRTAHQDYDAGKLRITALTRKGADGPLKFTRAK